MINPRYLEDNEGFFMHEKRGLTAKLSLLESPLFVNNGGLGLLNLSVLLKQAGVNDRKGG